MRYEGRRTRPAGCYRANFSMWYSTSRAGLVPSAGQCSDATQPPSDPRVQLNELGRRLGAGELDPAVVERGDDPGDQVVSLVTLPPAGRIAPESLGEVAAGSRKLQVPIVDSSSNRHPQERFSVRLLADPAALEPAEPLQAGSRNGFGNSEPTPGATGRAGGKDCRHGEDETGDAAKSMLSSGGGLRQPSRVIPSPRRSDG